MNQSLMKTLFSFFLFLVLGCVKLSARHTVDVQALPSYSVAHSPQGYGDDLLLMHHNFLFPSVHTTLEANHRTVYTTDNEKVEEEESITAKKGSSIPALSKDLFPAQFVTLSYSLKKEFPPRNYFVYFPSNTIQILFCTFRI